MKRLLVLSMLLVLVSACSEDTQPVGVDLDAASALAAADAKAAKHGGAVLRPFKFSKTDFDADWAIDRNQELACGGDEVAGGSLSGEANITHLGRSTVEVTAAWNIGDQLDPSEVQYEPVGPVGGPVAPVLGQGEYPYSFHFNPLTGTCGSFAVANGTVRITAANGAELHGLVVGGETHRLDFLNPGDGVESFVEVEIVGGTGRFEDASGSFVAHVIIRFDYGTGRFVIDLAETLPGGTIAY